MNPRKQRSSGFTLVELLVVMTIIGMLVGMLLPAVMVVRANMYNTACKRQLGEVGLAAFQYEAAHNSFPGYINNLTVSGGTSTVPVGWGVYLMPYLGRTDIWNAYTKGGGGGGYLAVSCLPQRSAGRRRRQPIFIRG